MNRRTRVGVTFGLNLILAVVLPTTSHALSPAFTYQGQLQQSGVPANGACDLRFGLYDEASGGTQIGATEVHTGVAVQDGLFSVALNEPGTFGVSAFDGADRWLQIDVRCPTGAGSFTTLAPRQQLTASPYALWAPSAGTADDLACAGCVGSTDLANGAVTSSKIAGGTIQPSNLAFIPGSVTSITAGSGLTGGTITTSGAIAANIGTGSGTVAAGNHTHASSYWSLSGNGGTTGGPNFVGTTDAQPLELRVNGARALRIEPDATSPRLIGGHGANAASPGAFGATIAGGGATANGNQVTDSYGTIGGGSNNRAGNLAGTADDARHATVGGGASNAAGGVGATVSGGQANAAGGENATIAGGQNNYANGPAAAAGGGRQNEASADTATIAGGWKNTASGSAASVGGGYLNSASASFATIGGGGPSDLAQPSESNNRVVDQYGTIGGGGDNRVGSDDGDVTNARGATVGGGMRNSATGEGATVAGGGGRNPVSLAVVGNKAAGALSTIAGGLGNEASGAYAAIGGGLYNVATGPAATIGGGGAGGGPISGNKVWDAFGTVGGGGNNSAGKYSTPDTEEICATVAGGLANVAAAAYAAIGGGQGNWVFDTHSTVGGGVSNGVTGPRSTVSGGYHNLAQGNAATVPGGADNIAGGAYSFAAGARAQASHAGSFVWSSGVPQASWGDDTFTARAPGGFRFYFDAGDGYCQLSGPNNWQCSAGSDRATKTEVAAVNGSEVLQRLAGVPIQTWSYRTTPLVRHIGPMAQDFSAAFGVGEDDTHISTVDADGVALAAIQGLYHLVQQRDAQIAALEARLAALEAKHE